MRRNLLAPDDHEVSLPSHKAFPAGVHRLENLDRDFAFFGAEPRLKESIGKSNSSMPDIEAFLQNSRVFFEAHQFTNSGPVCLALEAALAKYHQVKYVVACSSWFWALALAVKELAIPTKCEVVIPSLAHSRQADVVAWAGLVPRLCEVDEATLTMTEETVASAINDQTALILPVHSIVGCAPVGQIFNLAASLGIPVLVDAFESVYNTLDGRRVGGWGDAEVFNLHSSNLINGFEGG